MSNENTKVATGNSKSETSDRMKKAAATRAITADKLGKLSHGSQYAYRKISQLRASLEALQYAIINGAIVEPTLVESAAMLDAECGKCIVQVM